jgi:hypothetical protein
MVGMRDAQDAYPNPDRKKKTALASRSCLGVRAEVVLVADIKLQI